ncbi:MAG: sigma-70 family RNA polymerase sigma factor [Oscillospiraceae bacterium]|jgi:RNA polymerase sporulation-specific sigma factor|nr:sigma-70 family RNA polymerase sigma factor [Oscillospiraceae bacterium]
MLISEKAGIHQNLSDEQLVSLAQGGSSRAVSLLLARLSALVRAKAAKLHSYGVDSDDLAQEGMLGLLSAIYTYKGNYATSFKTYASVCVGNRILSSLKKASRQKRLPLLEYNDMQDNFIDQRLNPEELVIAEEEFDRLKTVLFSGLSQTEYRVITLYLAGCSYEEIAKKLGSTAKSVDNALQRVRRKLRDANSVK